MGAPAHRNTGQRCPFHVPRHWASLSRARELSGSGISEKEGLYPQRPPKGLVERGTEDTSPGSSPRLSKAVTHRPWACEMPALR